MSLNFSDASAIEAIVAKHARISFKTFGVSIAASFFLGGGITYWGVFALSKEALTREVADLVIEDSAIISEVFKSTTTASIERALRDEAEIKLALDSARALAGDAETSAQSASDSAKRTSDALAEIATLISGEDASKISSVLSLISDSLKSNQALDFLATTKNAAEAASATASEALLKASQAERTARIYGIKELKWTHNDGALWATMKNNILTLLEPDPKTWEDNKIQVVRP